MNGMGPFHSRNSEIIHKYFMIALLEENKGMCNNCKEMKKTDHLGTRYLRLIYHDYTCKYTKNV